MADLTEEQYNAILNNHRLPRSVRYAMIREAVCAKLTTRKERREVLLLVGQHLKGELHPGRIVVTYGPNGEIIKSRQNYWEFPDNTKAKFQQ
jgi:hypothetical protein